MSWKKLDRKARTCIVAGVFCFALGLVFFVINESILSLIAFTLASLLPLWAVGGRRRTVAHGGQKVEDDIIVALQDQLESSKTEIRKHSRTIESKEKEIDRLKRSLEQEKENVVQATIRADMAEAATGSKETDPGSDDKETETFSGILPQAQGDDGKNQILDITGVIRNAARDFKSAADRAGVIINIVEPSEPMFVSAAPVMLRTMFRDIIDNALKYMMRSGVLQITVANLDDDIFVAMKDNGKGLDESETGHIFELNYQGSNRVSGNGLGLAQVKAIVDHYGGMIYAKSSPGRGMGIYLHLPAVRK